MKVGCQSYRGIDFVCVDDLPGSQQYLLNTTPESPERIKILINNKTVENCIQYKEYEQWYHAVFVRSAKPAESQTKSLENLPVTLVFDKA